MIEMSQFTKTEVVYFDFLITEFGFKLAEDKIRNNVFCDVKYKDETKVISISYENIENYLMVIVYILQNGILPNYDDKTKTLHLNQLNAIAHSKIEKSHINLNNMYFSKFKATKELEKKLLKSAKELRLCMIYFSMDL